MSEDIGCLTTVAWNSSITTATPIINTETNNSVLALVGKSLPCQVSLSLQFDAEFKKKTDGQMMLSDTQSQSSRTGWSRSVHPDVCSLESHF